MLKKVLAAAVLTAASGAALAHPPQWAPAHGYRAHHYQPYVRQYYYAPPPRVVYRPVPVYPPALVIRLRLPL